MPSGEDPAPHGEELPPAPPSGDPDCGQASGARLLLALEAQADDWMQELGAYQLHGMLPEKEEDAKRMARQVSTYCIRDGALYHRRPNDVALRCISRE